MSKIRKQIEAQQRARAEQIAAYQAARQSGYRTVLTDAADPSSTSFSSSGSQLTPDGADPMAAAYSSSYSPASAYSSTAPRVVWSSRDGRQIMSIPTDAAYGRQIMAYQLPPAPSLSVFPTERAKDVRDWLSKPKPAVFKRITYDPFELTVEVDKAATIAAKASEPAARNAELSPRLVITAATKPTVSIRMPSAVEGVSSLANIAQKDTKVPAAVTVRPGRAEMPFPPHTVLNVEGMPSGSIAMDPTTERMFQVP